MSKTPHGYLPSPQKGRTPRPDHRNLLSVQSAGYGPFGPGWGARSGPSGESECAREHLVASSPTRVIGTRARGRFAPSKGLGGSWYRPTDARATRLDAAPAADHGGRGRRRADDPRRPGPDAERWRARPRRRSRQRTRRDRAGARSAPRRRADRHPAPRQLRRAGDRPARAARPRLARTGARRAEENRVVEAIVAGASGYILKTAPPEAIIAAVGATAAGESVISSRSPGNSCSASANATCRSPPPATTPRARSAPS